ncbi:MAG: MBL fold metallo-hydrolase [Firmicutes bacterium]|nr:MBL fold metallo-hydrolase [Bacillota bacterium]
MHLTVIGCYGPYPPAGGACSGYLLEKDEFKILIDCGSGVLSRLQNFVSLWELDALVLSHLHGDHTSDLTVLRYALDAASSRGLRTEPLPLYAPPEPKEKFERLRYKDTLRIIPLKAGRPLQIGPFKFDFLSTVHSMLCLAMRIESEHSTLVYTGDSEYFPLMAEFAHGADLFLCEANLPEEPEDRRRAPNHTSASQAGLLAASADVGRLILTHLPPGEDLAKLQEEARKHFSRVEIAREGKCYPVKK